MQPAVAIPLIAVQCSAGSCCNILLLGLTTRSCTDSRRERPSLLLVLCGFFTHAGTAALPSATTPSGCAAGLWSSAIYQQPNMAPITPGFSLPPTWIATDLGSPVSWTCPQVQVPQLLPAACLLSSCPTFLPGVQFSLQPTTAHSSLEQHGSHLCWYGQLVHYHFPFPATAHQPRHYLPAITFLPTCRAVGTWLLPLGCCGCHALVNPALLAGGFPWTCPPPAPPAPSSCPVVDVACLIITCCCRQAQHCPKIPRRRRQTLWFGVVCSIRR